MRVLLGFPSRCCRNSCRERRWSSSRCWGRRTARLSSCRTLTPFPSSTTSPSRSDHAATNLYVRSSLFVSLSLSLCLFPVSPPACVVYFKLQSPTPSPSSITSLWRSVGQAGQPGAPVLPHTVVGRCCPWWLTLPISAFPRVYLSLPHPSLESPGGLRVTGDPDVSSNVLLTGS
jgi:hypothetical protein